MRVLVCGGRDFADKNREEYKFVFSVLHCLCELASEEYNPFDSWLPTDIVIIEGGARGADNAAGDFALVNFCQHIQFPADWKTHGKKAGYIRNKQMLDEGKPDLVIAFLGGKGTAMMVDLATKAGVFDRFDGEALTGIYRALSDRDKAEVTKVFDNKYAGFPYQMGTRERAYAAYCAMRDLGFIVPPPPVPPSDAGAAEYDEIIAVQDLMLP